MIPPYQTLKWELHFYDAEFGNLTKKNGQRIFARYNRHINKITWTKMFPLTCKNVLPTTWHQRNLTIYCRTRYLSTFQVGKRSNFKRTSCECRKLTANAKSFGGGLTIPTINPIDFRNIFTNFLSLLQANPTVFATIITILAVYFLLAVWARRSDKADVERVRRCQ